jgi:hypothetical protein
MAAPRAARKVDCGLWTVDNTERHGRAPPGGATKRAEADTRLPSNSRNAVCTPATTALHRMYSPSSCASLGIALCLNACLLLCSPPTLSVGQADQPSPFSPTQQVDAEVLLLRQTLAAVQQRRRDATGKAGVAASPALEQLLGEEVQASIRISDSLLSAVSFPP